MLNVQRYLRTEGKSLESLTEELGIVVNEYDHVVTLNYNQIDSPRFHPICDECRALILEKGTWDIVARSFNRFYNLGEGHNEGHGYIRLPSYDDHQIIPFSLIRATTVTKLDGTLITAYWYNDTWNFSTRKMAFAEGQTNFDMSFRELIETAADYGNVMHLLRSFPTADAKKFCWVFELTSPANRIVTPYNHTNLNLLAVVHKGTGIEFDAKTVHEIANQYKIRTPFMHSVDSWEGLVTKVNSFAAMEEGVVLILEDNNFTAPLRIKVKNPKFVAIAHMRENGGLSPKNVLRLVMENEVEEYLGYFPEDKPYFCIVQRTYDHFIQNIKWHHDGYSHMADQKEFALAIQKHLPKNQWGFLFKMRKCSDTVEEMVHEMGPKKLANVLNLKAEFVKVFGTVVEDEA